MSRGRGRRAIIADLRRHLSLDRFSCDPVGRRERLKLYDGREVTRTELVRECTKLWRESWIFPLLDELDAKETKERKS